MVGRVRLHGETLRTSINGQTMPWTWFEKPVFESQLMRFSSWEDDARRRMQSEFSCPLVRFCRYRLP